MLDALDQLRCARPRRRDGRRGASATTRCDAMHARGVRALRLDLFLRAQLAAADIVAYIKRSVRRVKAARLAPAVLHARLRRSRPRSRYLADIDVRLRHRSHGLHAGKRWSDARRLRPLDRGMRRGRGWMKLSGPVSRRQGRQLRAARAACARHRRGARRSHRLGQRLAAHSERRAWTPARCSTCSPIGCPKRRRATRILSRQSGAPLWLRSAMNDSSPGGMLEVIQRLPTSVREPSSRSW